LGERLGTTLRHLKIAAEWGLQVVFYPLYLLVQTGRLAQGQLEQRVKHREFLPSSESSTPDPPIEQFLKAVEPLVSLPDVTENPVPEFQGVATCLDNHRLVLVTSNNELLDIFPPEQQDKLLGQIRFLIANYCYERRLIQQTQRNFPGLVPTFVPHNPNVLPPIRWFWEFIGWMQSGQVAIAVNLFGESSLMALPYQEMIIQDITKKTREPEPFQIQALIRAAINYFYGRQRDKLEVQSSVVSEEDNWLSWDDLFTETIPGVTTPSQLPENQLTSQKNPPLIGSAKEQRKSILPSPNLTPTQPEKSILGKMTSLLTQGEKSTKIEVIKTTPKTLIQTKISPTNPSVVALTTPQKNTAEVEAKPDWIETEATHTGYVKHILEIILEGLDYLIVRFEELALKLWDFISRRR
jgi:hypothetical protein